MHSQTLDQRTPDATATNRYNSARTSPESSSSLHRQDPAPLRPKFHLHSGLDKISRKLLKKPPTAHQPDQKPNPNLTARWLPRAAWWRRRGEARRERGGAVLFLFLVSRYLESKSFYFIIFVDNNAPEPPLRWETREKAVAFLKLWRTCRGIQGKWTGFIAWSFGFCYQILPQLAHFESSSFFYRWWIL